MQQTLEGTLRTLRRVGAAVLNGCWERAWPSYLALFAVQAKILWRAWDFRDLTGGDTSSYFRLASAWADGLQLHIAWSPLYTAFFGSFSWLTGDPYLATIAHRLVIVVLAGAGVLFVLRRLLAPPLALLAAVYWTALPIVFDTLYEVHIFALLPVLAFWIVALTNDSPPGRVAAVTLLVAAAILVRNEFSVGAGVALLLAVVFGRRRGETGRGFTLGWRGAATIATIAALLVGLAYWRSVAQFPRLSESLANKHQQNMCQVYAFGYAQRHPEWTRNPWTECRELAGEVFGRPEPSFRQMLQANPGAVMEHMLWNLRLVPAGAQVLLFDATSTDLNPDYPRPKRRSYPRVLGWLAFGLIAAGGVAARRLYRRGGRVPEGWLRRIGFAALPPLAMAIPVVLTQRPRPSYFFYLGVMMIAVGGGSAAMLLALTRRGRTMARATALLTVAAALIALPSYYSRHPSERPLRRDVERLLPHAGRLASLQDVLVLGDRPGEIAGYLNLPQSNAAWEGTGRLVSSGVWARWERGEPIAEFLRREEIVAFYLDTKALARLYRRRGSRRLLDEPNRVGWELAAGERAGDQPWVLMVRRSG